MTRAAADQVVPSSVRGESAVRATFQSIGGITRIGRVHERGGLRLRMPRAAGRRELVLINTGGGIAGGDRLSVELTVGAGADVVVTSQAAEKIYKSDGPAATIDLRISLDREARLDWLPQETILFAGAAAARTLDIDMAGSARLTLLECLVLGRIACGEQLESMRWRDRWRIRRDRRLAFAEDVRLDGNVAAMLERPAIGAGARAIATLVHIAPDAERRLDEIRAALPGTAGGASAWNGMLVVRLAAPDACVVKSHAIRAAMNLTGREMPRSWSC